MMLHLSHPWNFLLAISPEGSVAEWSKALVLGTSLCGGVGSNPTAAITLFENVFFHFLKTKTCAPGEDRTHDLQIAPCRHSR